MIFLIDLKWANWIRLDTLGYKSHQGPIFYPHFRSANTLNSAHNSKTLNPNKPEILPGYTWLFHKPSPFASNANYKM